MNEIAHDDFWYAGDIGCGDLVVRLRMELKANPGKVFKVKAIEVLRWTRIASPGIWPSSAS